MNNSVNDPLINRESIILAQAGNYFTNIWEKIVNFLTSYQWKELIFALKTASIIISLIFGFLIVVLLIKVNIGSKVKKVFSPSKPVPAFNKKRIQKKWIKIEKRLKTGAEANFKLAVLEADKIFNDILKDVGYEAEIKISNKDEIKQAGKIKNKIIDDSEFSLTEIEAQKIVDAYKRGLEDLGAI